MRNSSITLLSNESKSTLVDAESLASDDDSIDESFANHPTIKKSLQNTEIDFKVSVPSLPTEFPDEEETELEVIKYHDYSDSELTDIMFGQKVIQDLCNTEEVRVQKKSLEQIPTESITAKKSTITKKNSSQQIIPQRVSSQKISTLNKSKENKLERPEISRVKLHSPISSRDSSSTSISLKSAPSTESEDYELMTFNPNVRSVFDRDCKPTTTQTSFISSLKSSIFGYPAHQWEVERTRY